MMFEINDQILENYKMSMKKLAWGLTYFIQFIYLYSYIFVGSSTSTGAGGCYKY